MLKKIIKEIPSLEGLKPKALIEAAQILKAKRLHWRVQSLFTVMLILSFGFAVFIIYDIFVFGLSWWLPIPIIAVSAMIGFLTARIYKFSLEKGMVTLARIDITAVLILLFYIALRIVSTPLLGGYSQNIYVVRGIIAATVLGVIAGRFLGVLQMIKKVSKTRKSK